MQVRVVQQSIVDIEADTLIVNLFAGVTEPGGATGALDRATGGTIHRLIRREGFKGELGQVLSFYTDDLRQVVIVGLGPRADFNLEAVRSASAAALKAARKSKARRVATVVHGAGIGGLEPGAAAQAVAEGSLLGNYQYAPFKKVGAKDTANNAPEELLITELDSDKLSLIQQGVDRGLLFAQSTNFARDLVNTPPNSLTPVQLAEAAQDMAGQVDLECEILDEEALKRLGAGALLGVAQGSASPPRLIVLRYRSPQSPNAPKIGLVGKGVTFDSGGLSLKTAEGMIAMKDDMAGAAAVLGAMRIIAHVKPAVDVVAVIPCVENMPSGSALRPGDVVHALDGKSIEIHNTDAEGRLILADGVAYARTQGVDAIIDVATLTGAIGIALGDVYTGVITNDDALMERLTAAAARSGERFWRLPGDKEYKELYKSDIADLKNVGGRAAGAITGGLIIGEFAEDTPWLHLDIAATAYNGKEQGYLPKGASGVAVRTLAELILNWEVTQ